jgi:hypothetical protein
MIKKGSWVQITRIVLEPEERYTAIPAETKKVPLQMWIKGWLVKDAKLGDEVQIKTRTNRLEKGTLLALNPTYHHDYGDFVPEILTMDRIIQEWMAKNE